MMRNTDAFDSERGKASRERMELEGFYGAASHAPEPPPVMQAAQDGDAQTLARLLHADPELARTRERGESQETSLHKAARGGHAAAVRLLLTYGADPFALNSHVEDALAVLLTSDASEQALRETARDLLAAEVRTPRTAGRNGQIVCVEGDILSEDDAVRQRAEADLEERRAVDTARWLRAQSQDCSRLCALLLHESRRSQDAGACRAALMRAATAGHGETVRVLSEWMRFHGAVPNTNPDDSFPAPLPAQSVYALCPVCLAWWVAPPDTACCHCGRAGEEAGQAHRVAWWPWGTAATEPLPLQSLEAAVHEALLDLVGRAKRIADSRVRISREARADNQRTWSRRLEQATSDVRRLQSEFQHVLWSAEIAFWWNLMETTVAQWDDLTFDECGRRLDWLVMLRARWRTVLTEWQGRVAADGIAVDGSTEPDAFAHARQALYACGLIQQGLLAARAALAVRAEGRGAGQNKLPLYLAEPSRSRLKLMTELAQSRLALDARRAALGERDEDSD